MAADAAGSSSLSVPELQRQLAELAEELRVRKEAEGFALQREAAIAEILSVINDPDANLSRVFDVLVEKATQLCSASYGHIWLYDGERARAVAAFAQKQFGDWLRDRESVPSKVTPLGQVLLHHRLVHVVDATAHEGYQKHAGFRELVDRGGIRTLLHVPLRKGGKLLGIITVYRQEGRPFSDRQITLLESFAAQAVIAMENARLFTEQREALEQQTATAEVLQVINTSPGDLAPVFDAMLDKAMTLCGAAFGFLTSYDGQRFTAVAMRGVPPSLAKYFAKGVDQPSPGEMHYRILHGEDVIHNLDQKDEEAYRSGLPLRRAVVDLGGGRTALVIALRKDGALLGILTIYRKEVRPFSDKQIALMRNFSAQAVIAIENARLLTEQREALERQTATAQVLQVINESPVDLAPVFDAMLERAVDLGEASFGIMNVYEDGEFRAVALRGVPDGLIEQWAAAPPPSARNALTRMFDGEDVVHIEDLAAYETYQAGDLRTRALVEIGGARSLLAVALRKEGVFLGSITAYRQEVRPFTDKQITLLQNFAAQAVIAMENARLLVELRASLEQQTATSDVLKTISRSSVDLEAVLKMLVETVARLCRADQSYMWRRREELYQLVAAHGLSDEARAFVETHPIAPDDRGTLNGRVSLERRTVHIPDTLQDADYRYSGQQITGFRTLLGIPLLREDVLIGIFNVARTRVDPFTDKEIELAASFADQAVIAIENARLFEELRERQAELRVTFDNMDDGVAMFDAEPRLVAWNRNFEQIVGMPEVRLAERPSYAEYLRLLAERGEFGTENVEAELASRLENTERELRMERTRADGTVIEVRRNAVPGGGFVLNYSDVTEQRRAEAAIRAARDAAEAALERQTATADILKVIASSPTDVHPVLEAVVKAAVRFCSATDAMIQLCEGDSVISTTHEGPLTYSAGVRRPLDRTTAGGRSIIDAQTCHLPDVEASDAAEFVTARKLGAQHGFRASVAAPLKRDGAAIGALVLRKVEPGPFTPQQIYLLETFAAQAVIAIENVRLFTELRELLEQQTATAEILTVISQSPTDVAPVLSAVAGAAMKFCGANDALVGLRDGNEWFIAAHEGPIETIIGTRRMLTRHTAPGRAMADGKVIQIKDLHSDDGNEFPEGREIGARTGFRSALAAPLLRDDVSVGAISLRRREAGEFEPRQVELLKTFAAQAVIAIQNVRLFSELRESLEQQTATAEILQAISQSPTDVQPVLDAVVKAALRFCGATDAVVILRESDDAVVAAHDGPLLMPPGSSFPLNLQTASGQAILGGLTCHFPDIPSLDRVEFAASHRIAAAQGFRAAVSAPLLRKGVAIGSVALRKAESGPFTPRQIELLETFAAQAVIAIENVRLFTELRDSLERLKAAQANLIQAEKMASLGQLTAGIAHEIKNPLNFVNNFSGLSVELLDDLKQAVDALLVEPDENKRAELQDTMDLLTGNLAKIVEHGRRADGIVKSMLSHSRGGKGDWQDSNINALVEEALNLAYHGARAQDQDFNVTLERDFASEPKSIEVVPQDVTRVFLNLFGNGFYATRKRHLGGADAGYRPTLTVSTRDLGDAVEVTVRDNGTGIQPAVRAKLFQPFFTTKPTGEGTGLGLSISYDIVTQQHGGSIDVESEPGYFTEFTVRLPRRRRAA